jgi:cytoskeletal protein CcmA (bactofilin family)
LPPEQEVTGSNPVGRTTRYAAPIPSTPSISFSLFNGCVNSTRQECTYTLYFKEYLICPVDASVEQHVWPQLYNPVKGGGNMVVSNQSVKGEAQHSAFWQRFTDVWESWVASMRRASMNCQGVIRRSPARQHHAFGIDKGQGQCVTIDLNTPDYLRERSLLMFRRENHEETFDDDVAALRDKVGSGRREPADTEHYPGDDQTTYSPPQQSWTPVAPAPRDEPESAPVAQRPATESGDASVIASDTAWDGNVKSSGSLHVHGQISGQIRADGDVYVAEGATVSANVHAGSVTVAGTLEGTVECTGRFEVMPTGRVSADVAAPRLVVHEGAVVVGKLRMTVDENEAS